MILHHITIHWCKCNICIDTGCCRYCMILHHITICWCKCMIYYIYHIINMFHYMNVYYRKEALKISRTYSWNQHLQAEVEGTQVPVTTPCPRICFQSSSHGEHNLFLVGGLVAIFYLSNWEFHHPNWRSHLFSGWNHQADWLRFEIGAFLLGKW